MVLDVHALIQWQDETPQARVERILCLDALHDQVMTIDVNDPRALPCVQSFSELERALAAGDIILLEQDPYAFLRQSESVLERRFGSEAWAKHCQRRDARWQTIAPIVTKLQDRFFHSHELGALVQEAYERTRQSKTHIYEYLRWYWQRGECRNALLPRYDRCGPARAARKPQDEAKKLGRPRTETIIADAAPGINVDDKTRAMFERGTRLYYDQRDKHPAARAFKKIEERFFNAGYTFQDGHKIPILLPREQRPTLRQYRYWLETDWDPTRSKRAREGVRRYNLRHRGVPGEYRASLGTLGPGSLFQIDATVGDVYLVSELERAIIGRPVIYIITDVFSTLITGFSVGLEGPSWAGAMLALENMACDKLEYCAEYDYIIRPEDWPSHHIPRRLCGDRAEMLSQCSDKLVSSFNITVSNTAAYRADWKGRVERDFRVLNDVSIRWIPGHTNGWRERGERDCRLDACMSLRNFTHYLIDTIIEYNTLNKVVDELLTPEMIRDGVEPFPADLWRWGIENLSGALRTEPRAVVQRNLLPDATATVEKDGIRFRRLHYMCDRARQERWLDRARVTGSWSVPILYDPRTPKRIYLLHDANSELELCELTARDARYATCTWADIEHHYALRLVGGQEREERSRPKHIEHETRRESIIAEAQQTTQEAQAARGPESEAARLRDIRERRQAERARERERTDWALGSEEEPNVEHRGAPVGEVVSEGVEDETAAEQAYAAQMLALLRGEDTHLTVESSAPSETNESQCMDSSDDRDPALGPDAAPSHRAPEEPEEDE